MSGSTSSDKSQRKHFLSRIPDIVEKARLFCAYQERSSSEIILKLKEWELDNNRIEYIINKLIEEGFVDDNRYARLFVRGKFRQKKWGRIKIVYELKRKNIKGELIQQALTEIDDEEYMLVLKEVAEKKSRELNSGNTFQKKQKLYTYLISKGFEHELAGSVCKEYFSKASGE